MALVSAQAYIPCCLVRNSKEIEFLECLVNMADLGRCRIYITMGLTKRAARGENKRSWTMGNMYQDPGDPITHCDSVTSGLHPCGQNQWIMDVDHSWIVDPRTGLVQGWTWMERPGSVQGRPPA